MIVILTNLNLQQPFLLIPNFLEVVRVMIRHHNHVFFCKGPHAAHKYFTVTDHHRRLDIVRQNNLCFNCLARHKVSQCASKLQCRNCKRKHHTSLCNGDQRANTHNISQSQIQIHQLQYRYHPPLYHYRWCPYSLLLTIVILAY